MRQYFLCNERGLTVKITPNFCYTRVATKDKFKPLEVKHELNFFDVLKEKYTFKPCNYTDFLTVNNEEVKSLI